MLSTNTVFEQLYLADPYGITEAALVTQVRSALGGRPVGNAELTEALGRLEVRRFIVSARNDDQDVVWSLTTEGRTEATHRFD
jgi:hypothetical protein